MCNRYLASQDAAEIARIFEVELDGKPNVSSQIYPASNGLVVESGKLRSMVWGFPLVMRSKKTGDPLKPKAVNNARTDKLDSRFWSASFRERRCLIPVTKFAEAEGQKGKMTVTWFSQENEEMLACAGVWRDSAEWGPCYSMLMTDANEAVAPVHDRMPVILARGDWSEFVQGSEDDAKALCRPFEGKLAVDRTNDLWVKK